MPLVSRDRRRERLRDNAARDLDEGADRLRRDALARAGAMFNCAAHRDLETDAPAVRQRVRRCRAARPTPDDCRNECGGPCTAWSSPPDSGRGYAPRSPAVPSKAMPVPSWSGVLRQQTKGDRGKPQNGAAPKCITNCSTRRHVVEASSRTICSRAATALADEGRAGLDRGARHSRDRLLKVRAIATERRDVNRGSRRVATQQVRRRLAFEDAAAGQDFMNDQAERVDVTSQP